MNPLITTIIPTYKRPGLLRRAVMSVLLQTESRLQVCVYDNASGDETRVVAEDIAKKDDRVRYYCHLTNIGGINNFNYGLEKVETPFFSFLSDDDVIAPDFYAKALKGFEKFPEAMFVCLGSLAVDANINVISDSTFIPEMKFFKAGEGFDGIANGTIPGTWTAILFRKQVKDEIGLVNPLCGPPADFDYVLRAAARFPFIVFPGIGGILMAHKNTVSGTIEPLSRSYLHWYENMVEDIVNDDKISSSVKIKAKKIPQLTIKWIGLGHISRGLKEENFDYSRKAAITLKECGYFLIGQFFLVLIWLYQYIKPAKLLLKFILRDRQRRKEQKFLELNKKYANVVEFIKKLNYELEI